MMKIAFLMSEYLYGEMGRCGDWVTRRLGDEETLRLGDWENG